MQKNQQPFANYFRFEDHTALHGGEDGLHVVKQILQVSSSLFGQMEG